MNKTYETAVNLIIEAIRNNKLVVFVGAGVSMNSGYLSWSGLIKKFTNELELIDGSEDNLKIAQLYYNTWGGKQYYLLLDKIFNDKYYEPNEIHKQILKLSPHHIITTNYDSLLEDEMLRQNKKYHIVKKDNDLAYDNKDRLIIKMHGDLTERNIVLKEDDYANYSINFGLIELYIKSLLINHTFLFIGYSLQDNNFKMIFNSIKSQLNEDFQRAIFFDSSDSISEIEVDYYRNKGINIIINNQPEEYLPQILKDKRGNRILKFIADINSNSKNNKKFLNSSKKEIEEYLKFLNRLPSLDPSLIINNEFFDGVYYNAKLKQLNSDKHILINQNDTNLINLLRIMRVENIPNLEIKNRRGNSNTDFKRLEKAYEKFLGYDFKSAIDLFKNESNYFFQRKNYFMTLICEYNIHVLTKTIDEKMSIVEFIGEYESLDEMIDDFKKNSDDEQVKLIQIFDPIFHDSYFNMIYYKLSQSLQKIIQSKILINRSDGFASINELSEHINNFNNFYTFICENKLCLTHFKKYREISKLYISGLLASISTKETGYFFEEIEIINKIYELDLFDIEIIINNIKTSDFEKLLKLHEVYKINITPDGLSYIYNSIIDQLRKGKINIYEINKVNIGFKLLKISNEIDDDRLIEVIKLFIEKKVIRHNYLEDLLIVINNNFKNINKENLYEVCNLIEKITLYLVEEISIKGYDNFYHKSLNILWNISKLSVGNNRELKINSKHLDERLLIINNNDEVSRDILSYKDIIIYLYNYFGDNVKNEIEKLIRKIEIELENLPIIDNQIIAFILETQDMKIYTYSNETFDKIIESIKYEIEKIIKKDDGLKSYPDPLEQNLFDLYYIYKNIRKSRKIVNFLNKNRNEFIGRSPEVDWEIYRIHDDNVIDNLTKKYFNIESVVRLFGNTKNKQDIIYNYIQRKYIDDQKIF